MPDTVLVRNRNAQPLPSKSARNDNRPYATARISLYLALVGGTCPLALFVVSPHVGYKGMVAGGVVASILLLVTLVSALEGLALARRLKRFEQGDYLAHWTCAADEWRAFADGEWQRRIRETDQAPMDGIIGFGILGLIGGATAGHVFSGGNLAAAVLGALAGSMLFALPGALFGCLLGAVGRLVGWHTFRGMCRCEGEIYIGADAAYCGGTLVNWSMNHTQLGRVEFVAGSPAVLEFTVIASRGGSFRRRVPVPRGREDEAREVAVRLSGRSGTAEAAAHWGSVGRGVRRDGWFCWFLLG